MVNNSMTIKISNIPASIAALNGSERLIFNQNGVTYTNSLSNIQQFTNTGYARLSASNTFINSQNILGSLTIGTTNTTIINSPPATDTISIGVGAGNGAAAAYSNFLGYEAGYGATGANNSNFFGQGAGNGATGASYSNFLGGDAGYGATDANNSNFLGSGAGAGATTASSSNFFGYGAGNGATGANNSNFFGDGAGNSATNAYNSNFLGNGAGNGATGALNSNFLGSGAGSGAIGATNCNFLGYGAGVGVTGGSNHLIGADTSVNPLSCSGCIVLGDSAIATQSNTIALGSTIVPLLTAGSGTSTGQYLVVRLNGQDLKLLLYV